MPAAQSPWLSREHGGRARPLASSHSPLTPKWACLGAGPQEVPQQFQAPHGSHAAGADQVVVCGMWGEVGRLGCSRVCMSVLPGGLCNPGCELCRAAARMPPPL